MNPYRDDPFPSFDKPEQAWDAGYAAALQAIEAQAENTRRYGHYGANMLRHAVKAARKEAA